MIVASRELKSIEESMVACLNALDYCLVVWSEIVMNLFRRVGPAADSLTGTS
jgi:hypothetical protein